MNTVGADKRTQYYRMEATAVLSSLKSHKLGLTNTDATRRHQSWGANILPGQQRSPMLYGVLTAIGHPAVALSALAALLASNFGMLWLAMVLLGLAVLQAGLRYVSSQARAPFDANMLLPAHTKVIRNGQMREIDTAKIVVGDILYLETGDTVPADVRLLEEQNLHTDDAPLLGGTVHTRKFAHTIGTAVPMIARNNLVWAGTTVVKGNARAVIIAIGAQTELGRISSLEQTARLNSRTAQTKHYTYAFAAAAFLSLILLGGWQSGADQNAVLAACLLCAVAMVPSGLPASRLVSELVAKRSLAKEQVLLAHTPGLAGLGSADSMIIDTTEASKTQATVSALTVGRTRYTVENTGYEPSGRILDDSGKPLSKKKLGELGLLFEAGALANTARVLRLDSHHPSWRVHGNLYEAAALVLARKAGLHTEQLRTKYDELRAIPYDAGRGMASSIRQYGSDKVVFVRGNPAQVLNNCKKIWDHGHVRPLSDNDRAFMSAEAAAAAHGSSMALAFRILSQNTDVDKLTADDAEQRLTLLGLISSSLESEMDTVVQAAQATGLRTIVVTNEVPAGCITSAMLRKLNDSQLLDALQPGGATFSRLNTEDIVRLVAVCQQTGWRPAVLGNNLSWLPALTAANVSITNCPPTSMLGARANMCMSDDIGLSTATALGRTLVIRFRHAYILAAVITAAAALLALAGAFELFYVHTPLPVSAPMLIALQLVFVPIAAFAARGKAAVAWRKTELLGAGMALAAAAYASFLAFFTLHGTNPYFLDQTSNLARAGASITAAVLVFGLWAEVSMTCVRSGYITISAKFSTYFAVSVLLILAMVYLPWLQGALGTASLSPADWLLALVATALYTSFRLFQRHTRKHSRHAVVALYHKHTKGSKLPKLS